MVPRTTLRAVRGYLVPTSKKLHDLATEEETETDWQIEIKHIHIIQYLTVLSIGSVWQRL